MATYKTPGVYIQEVSNLPPSAVQVETALPAFIGYTEKTIYQGKSLVNVPTRITSIIEFVQLYGKGPEIKGMDVTVHGNRPDGKPLNARGGRILDVEISGQYFLYDCLCMFYLNGGGDAYIVSTGKYTETGDIDEDEIMAGLRSLEEEDAPTMLVVPDLMLAGSASLAYNVQQAMLMQCGAMQNRVGLLDIYGADTVLPRAISSAKVKPVKNFRDKIGKNFLDYAAAYYPWLESTLSREIDFNRIRLKAAPNGDVEAATPLSITEYLESSAGVRNVTVHLSFWNAQVADTFRIAPKFDEVLAAMRSYRDGEDKGTAAADAVKGVITAAKPGNVESVDKLMDDAAANLTAAGEAWGKPEEELSTDAKTEAIDLLVDEALLKVETAYADLVMSVIRDYDAVQLGIDKIRTMEAAERDAGIDEVTTKLTALEATSKEQVRKDRLKAASDGLASIKVAAETASFDAGIAAAAKGLEDSGIDKAADIKAKVEVIKVDTPTRDADIAGALEDIDKLLSGTPKPKKKEREALEASVAALEPLTTAEMNKARIAVLESAKENVVLTRSELELKQAGMTATLNAAITAVEEKDRTAAVAALTASLEQAKTDSLNTGAINAKVEEAKKALEGVDVKDNDKYNAALSKAGEHMSEAMTLAETMLRGFVSEARKEGDKFLKVLEEISGSYRNLKAGIMGKLNLLPPSGAIAGIYAYVDRNRGVWKAPANVSLTGVTQPNIRISDHEQENLNVDADSGKSVNAIREFAGKGTLVWGARTLLGNNNEWRYISVRRFFIMVEQSLKKGTQWAVFEPNDAKTWSLVRGMIKSFLTQQWKAGALAGSSPDQAFFVSLGLGSTMTAQDILEGRMIVEIGMAVVRPAEFVILRFSHKMQES